MRLSRLNYPHDAIGGAGANRAVGLEINMQRVDIVDADLLGVPSFSTVKRRRRRKGNC